MKDLRRNIHLALINEDQTSLCIKSSLTKCLNKNERYLTCHPKKGSLSITRGVGLSRGLMYSTLEEKISMC